MGLTVKLKHLVRGRMGGELEKRKFIAQRIERPKENLGPRGQ